MSGTGRGRWVATLAAVVIVGAQLLALAHSHSRSAAPQLTPCGQALVAADVCALCILAFHAPLSLAPTPAPARSVPAAPLTTGAETPTLASGSHAFVLTRAPPTAA